MRRSPKNVKIAWNHNGLTHYGGVVFFREFIQVLQLRRFASWHLEYALRKIPTRAFAANALYLEVLRLAYNLVTAFQRTCLPPTWQELTLGKLRHRLFWLPGELTRPQNRPTLRLPGRPAVQAWSERILRQVHKLEPLEKENG
jgi:Transposase DDE domain group 1